MKGDGTIRQLPGDLPCAVCEEWLHFYLEGEADPFLSRAIGSHLEVCPGCAALHRRLAEERVELVEALIRSPALSERFPGRVMEEIRRQEAEERDRRLRSRITRIGLAGTALAGIATIAILLSLAGRPATGPAGPQSPVRVAAVAPVALLAVLPAPGGKLPAGERFLAGNLRPLTIFCPEDPPQPRPELRTPGAAALEVRSTLVSGFRPGPRLSETIEFSAAFIRREDAVPCTRDVNHDGQTNVSDAAHLFMLSMAVVPARSEESLSPSEIDPDPDCMTVCQVY